jgi:FMN reductase
MSAPLIVGLGGTTRPGSTSARAVQAVLARADELGVETDFLDLGALDLPMYAPERPERSPEALAFVDAIRRADGLVVGTPGYHGSLSGLVKNALDYIEDLREDERPYLHGRAVGCVVSAAGWQATTTTMVAVRSIVHALRGWPTPFGMTLNSAEPIFDADGSPATAAIAGQFALVAEQVVSFTHAGPGIRA